MPVDRLLQAAVMREVAEALGNTAAVARGSYIDPRVVAGYEQGLTIAPRPPGGAGVRSPLPLKPFWSTGPGH